MLFVRFRSSGVMVIGVLDGQQLVTVNTSSQGKGYVNRQ